ncbi:MAG: hypothetical protein NTY23_15650 [Chloroflexi bacterium]|nr:hypothetical protein [Chloroflexota bacterium]
MCRVHGGSAPQVKAKALERLKALQDPAITRLEQLIGSVQEQVALGAIKDVLDRTGLKPTGKLEHSLKVDTDSKTEDQLKARLAEIAAEWEQERKARVHAD